MEESQEVAPSVGIEPTEKKMVIIKYDVDKFIGANDFSLWQVKMEALLLQQGLAKALDGEAALPKGITEDVKQTTLKKAHSALILSFGDKPLRDVSKEKKTKQIWDKLSSIYKTKSQQNHLYLKRKLYSFKMNEEKQISNHVDEFNKIYVDLQNVDVVLQDEDKAIMFLNAIPKSYEQFRDAMIFVRTSFTFDEVQTMVKTKELKGLKKSQEESRGEGMMIRGRIEKKDYKHNKGR